MCDPLPKDSSHPSTEALARRFERLCRLRGFGCRVNGMADDGVQALELRVTPLFGDVADALAIRGLDSESWSDAVGMEGLARVVGVWLGSAPAGNRVPSHRSEIERGTPASTGAPRTPRLRLAGGSMAKG
jgi:hypothetical protein